jgi:ubiquitin carboxyl-terminal hydrolase 7
VLVPRNGIVDDLIAGTARKLGLDGAAAKNLRVFEVQGGKYTRELLPDLNVNSVTEFTVLYVERMPEEELNATEDERFVYCFHFDKEPSKPHGIPFKFVVKPGEVFKDTKERISKRTGIKGKLLQQVKFAIVPRGTYAKPRYIEDDEILLDVLQDDDSLGLDHVNKTRNFWGRAEGMFIK